jgi:hypothetical protein
MVLPSALIISARAVRRSPREGVPLLEQEGWLRE